MNAINPIFGRAMTHEEYANEWSLTATHLAASGHYSWMTQQLVSEFESGPRVIEVGCGSGASTLSLVKAGCRVICIEENEQMIVRAREHLQENGIVIQRVEADEMRNIDWAGGDGTAVRMVHMNVFDPTLSERLPREMDAIVCWLIGARPGAIADQLDKEHAEFVGDEMPEYRRQLQVACYTLGQTVLKPEGIVHFVDRAAMRAWTDKDAMRDLLTEAHVDMAGSGYTVTKENAFFRRIEDNALKSSNIKYVSAQMPGTPGAIAFGSVKAVLNGE